MPGLFEKQSLTNGIHPAGQAGCCEGQLSEIKYKADRSAQQVSLDGVDIKPGQG